MFNTICGSWSSVQEWSTLLVQLIVRGVVDLTNNSDLFTLLLDMLAILIHSALIQDREGNLSCLLPVKVTEWTHFEIVLKIVSQKQKRKHSLLCVVGILPWKSEGYYGSMDFISKLYRVSLKLLSRVFCVSDESLA